MRKKMISLVMSIVLAVSLIFICEPDQVYAISQNDVVSQLNSYISQYNGKAANSNQMYKGSQCKGFANWIFLKIFGVYIGAYPESANYKISNPNAQIVGILEPGNLNEASARELLQKGVPGDYIQVQRSTARGRGPHSMILTGVNDSGIEVFDCNSDGRNTIKKYAISWSAFDTANRAMSLYHAHGYSAESAAPSNPQISKNQIWYDLQDRIEITAHADGATSYFMSIFKEGNKIISQGVDGGKFCMDARSYGEGNYSAYFSCSNSAGTVDTQWIDFSVVGAATYGDVRVSNWWYDLTDTVSITVDTICAKGQRVEIDRVTPEQVFIERVIQENCESIYTIPAAQLGKGNYCAYFYVYNGSGGVYTKTVNFEIVDKPKENAVVSSSKSNYTLEDEVEISVLVYCSKTQVIGIDREGTGRVVTADADNGKYKIPASKLGKGKYSAYFSVWNASGGYDTSRIEFTIGDEISNPTISIEKNKYAPSEEIKISASADGEVEYYTAVIYDSKGTEVVRNKFTGYDFTISASKLKPGTYTAKVICSNSISSVETKTVSFEVSCSHNYTASVTKKPSCTQTGIKTYQCACGASYTEKIKATGHIWDDGKITKEPTAKEEGTRTYTCHSCGEIRTEQIPATGQKDDNMDEDDTEQDSDDNMDEDDTEQDSDDNMDEDEEEPEALEVGDLVEDISGDAMYEVISVNETDVCVEYVESANDKAKTIKIPANITTEDGVICKVTSISERAFEKNKRIKKVVIGSNVKMIGKRAFYGCKNLSTVSLGKKVVLIGDSAFSGCKNLKSLVLPAKVTQIGSNAFYGCKGLKKLQIKTSKLTAKKLGKKAFRGLPAKTILQVPKSKLKTYKKIFRQRGLSHRNKVKS